MADWDYVRNRWYVAGWAKDIGRQLTERWLLDTPILVYRTEAGEAVAMDNRCIHHLYPLHLGKLIGDTVECGYHGFTFDCTGKCVRIPGQDKVPAKTGVKRYPVVERHSWIWIWMGDADKADEGLIPNFFWLDHPDWVPCGGLLEINSRYGLMNENLLDLSHVEFVHRGSIGVDDISKFPIITKVEDDTVRISRAMTNIEAAPLFTKTMGISGKVDRWQMEEFTPPSYHVVHVDVAPHGTPQSEATGYKVINAVVPMRHNKTAYFWAISRSFAPDQEWITDYMQKAVQSVFMEDVSVCEALEKIMTESANLPNEFLAKIDAGVVGARRLMQTLRDGERLSVAS